MALEERGEDVQLSVNNERNPISEEEGDRIFDFLTTAAEPSSSSAENWGIGLTLVRLVVEAHKGDIRIESRSPEGTAFILRLSKCPQQPCRTRANPFRTSAVDLPENKPRVSAGGGAKCGDCI